MIRLRLDRGEAAPALIVGLTDENILRMQAGQPASFNLDEMGLGNVKVVIAHGATQADIVHEVHEHGLIDKATRDELLKTTLTPAQEREARG